MKNKFFLSIFLVCMISIFAGEALACKCASSQAEGRFTAANKVFLGEIVSIKKFEYSMTAVFKVETSWKGVTKDKIAISTSTDSCGMSFAVGEKHLLWVNGNETDSCDNHIEGVGEFLKDKPKLELETTNLTDSQILSQSNLKGENSSSTDQETQDSNSELEREEPFWDFDKIAVGVITFLVFDTIILAIIFFLRRRKK